MLAQNVGEQPTSKQTVNLIAPLHDPPIEDNSPKTAFCSHHDVTVKDSVQVHQCQKRNPDASQGIQEPSKSERNGCPKRKRVDFAIAHEDAGRLTVLAKTDSVNGNGYERRSGRDRVDRHLKDITQAQHATEDNE